MLCDSDDDDDDDDDDVFLHMQNTLTKHLPYCLKNVTSFYIATHLIARRLNTYMHILHIHL